MPSAVEWSQRLAARTATAGGEITAILALADAGDVIAFSGGFPAPETFPAEVLRELADDLLRPPEAAGALQYTPTHGLPGLRAAIIDMLGHYQERQPEPAELLVTSGGMEAMSLLARVLLDPGDLVLVEAPTYLGALSAFAGFEARVEGLDTDEDGLLVDQLEARLAAGQRPKLVYVIPDYQNPTGRSLSAERRLALVEACRRYGTLLVEDVAYRDLGFDGDAPRSLWSLAPDVVVQVGTFSKIFAPAFRLGWAVGPAPLVAAMTAAKQTSDQCAGGLGQRLLEGYLAGGHLDRHVKAARALYATRAAAMTAALARHLGGTARGAATWTTPRGGFYIWVTVPGADTTALAADAVRHGTAYVPGAPFYPDGRGRDQLRLSYSRADEEQVDEGIRRLAGVLGRAGRQP